MWAISSWARRATSAQRLIAPQLLQVYLPYEIIENWTLYGTDFDTAKPTGGHPTVVPTRPRLSKGRMAVMLVLLILVVSVGTLYFGSRYFGRNDFLVVRGELYRASQPDKFGLESETENFRLKSVINMRGENLHAAWYQQEIATCRAEGIVHADVRFSAKELPPPEEVSKLFHDFDTLPKPILIHCKAGSDRTGLAGTIYLIDQKGMQVAEASKALSWHFGHLAIYPYFEMDEFVQLFTEENPQHFSLREWVKSDYPAIYQRERRETTWTEMTEPIESCFKISYWKSTR